MVRRVDSGLALKRVYDAPCAEDGTRVLVDRLWPRGVSKEAAGIDVWMKELAPSTELRKWFGHEPERWAEFRRRYEAELAERGALLDELAALAAAGRTTLVFSARDTERNQAVVLRRVLHARVGLA